MSSRAFLSQWINQENSSFYILSMGADNLPIHELVISIEPVQSGEGDPSPENIRPISGWNGCNIYTGNQNSIVNMFDIDALVPQSYSSATLTKIDDTTFNITNTTSTQWDGARMTTLFSVDPLKAYLVSIESNIVVNNSEYMVFGARSGSGGTMLSGANVRIPVNSSDFNTWKKHTNVFIGKSGTNQQLNIITTVIKSPSNVTFRNAYFGELTRTNIPFPEEVGTVYGGRFDAVNGVLMVTHANIASYNGEELPGVWISDRDVYQEGATPTTGAQVVYELAEPIIYHLSHTSIYTVLGDNYILADCGNILKVTYPSDADLFMENQFKMRYSNE